MHQCRTASLAAIPGSLPHDAVAREKVGAVYRLPEESGDRRCEFRYASARSLCLYRHTNRVSVIFDQEKYRQPPERRHVQRLPELAFARGAFPSANQRHLVRLCAPVARSFRASHRLQELRAGRR